MKKVFFLLITCFLQSAFVAAQAVSPSKGAKLLKEIPAEKIFVHYNSSLLFAGEYLYFKLYNLNSETGNLNRNSKLAYVELIGQDENKIFHKKILLDNGRGQGDFFIPTNVPSGKYKLLAYTNWMRNDKTFFAGDLVIINPYRGDQSALSATPTGGSQMKENSSERSALGSATSSERSDASLKISLEKDLFNRRERVALNMEGAPGYYSLSVRIKDSINLPNRFTSRNFDQLFKNRNSKKDSIYIPELRGNLISGRIIPVSPEATKLAGKKVAFSIPGENFIFKVATTDSRGRFYINLDDELSTPEAIVQIIGQNSEDLEIKLDPSPQIDFPTLEFADFVITQQLEEWIIDRSVYNQIENAYYSIKPDTLKVPEDQEPFYTVQPELYDLDAYTRFETIKETFVEIIKSSWISSGRNRSSEIVVRQPKGATNYYLPSLLLVDGVMVEDHDIFINYPAKAVKSIKILRSNFFVGSHIFAGIVDVKTIGGEFWKTNNSEKTQKIELDIPLPKRYYFKQSYKQGSPTAKETIPDFRIQLYWEPSLTITPANETVEFYTSDIPGTYEIHLEGFTEDGKPVSVKKEFSVLPLQQKL